MTQSDGVRVEVVNADALDFPSDVLVLKYAQGLHGVDKIAAERLQVDLTPQRLPPDGFRLIPSRDSGLGARLILFVGVVQLRDFRYREIREFSAKALRSLAGEVPDAAHVAITLHGTGYGLDEQECFLAELGGVLDATGSGDVPRDLRTVSFVEANSGRCNRLQKLVTSVLPEQILDHDPQPLQQRLAREQSVLRSVGFDSGSKPLIFVAMPINDETEDRFHYGIQPPIDALGCLCERIDKSPGTGDLVDRIRQTIDRSIVVVADLTDFNPNVFLEVGYAWGKGIPTVLLISKDQVGSLPFDVRTQTCLVYDTIHSLEQHMATALPPLLAI